MTMQLPYQTYRDATLPHQVVLFIKNETLHVSCNCLTSKEKGERAYHSSMGRAVTLDNSRELYNNPKNHLKTFTKEDEAKW